MFMGIQTSKMSRWTAEFAETNKKGKGKGLSLFYALIAAAA